MAPPSKACDQCRRRRVRCDESRPKCLRCVKAKLKCGGYRPFEVIRYEYDAVVRKKQSRQACSRAGSEPASERSQSKRYNNDSSSPTDSDSDSPISHNLRLDPIILYLNYAHAHLFNTYDPQTWTYPDIADDLSHRSFVALATYFFGNEHGDPATVELGLRLYGRAIKDLNESLGDDSKRRSLDVFGAVHIMTTFEYLISSSHQGWVAHACGLENLMQLLGPAVFNCPQRRLALEKSRIDIILASLILRKTTILSEEKWKTIPWKGKPSSKSLFNCLEDILADCTYLLILQDQLVASSHDSERRKLALALFVELQVMLDQLKEWKLKWDLLEKDYCVEHHGPRRCFLATSWPFSRTRLWYKSLYHAKAMTFYNGIVILVEGTLQRLISAKLIPQLSGCLPVTRDYIAAIDICRSVHYCVEASKGGMGCLEVVFPIRMAWQVLRESEPELTAWLEETLNSIQSIFTGRWAVAGYALKLGTPVKLDGS